MTETRHSERLGFAATSRGGLLRHNTPHGLVVRPAVAADLPAILSTAHAAFGYDLEAKLIEQLAREGRVAASVVAVDGDCLGTSEGADRHIVGHALLSRVMLAVAAYRGGAGHGATDGAGGARELAERGATWPALALAPVAIVPEHQGRGIGSALVRRCVRLADPGLPIFVIGDPAYYGRFGFEAAGAHGITSRFEVPPGHFMVRLAERAPTDAPACFLDYPAAFGGL